MPSIFLKKSNNIVSRLISFGVLCFICPLFISCSNYKFYCVKGDPKSLRIIPKKEPFTPISDSVGKYINLTVGSLTGITPKVEIGKRQHYTQLIEKLDNISFTSLSLLKAYYEAYRSRPCDESAYKDYLNNLTKYQEHLNGIKNLYNDVEKITKGGGITGSNSSALIDRISKYLNNTNEIINP